MQERISQVVLISGFLAVIVGVPIAQVAVEMHRGVPVQATDLFRYPPTVKNLRGFEQALEDGWWGNEQVRPTLQRFLYLSVTDTGVKAVPGRENWLFYRPGVQYLVGRNQLEQGDPNSTRVKEPTGQTRRDAVAKAIVRFRDQLQERGLKLLVVPVPNKASVYPEQVTSRYSGKPDAFSSPTEGLLRILDKHGVETVDLFAAFRDARKTTSVQDESPLYLARDTHWTPKGAAIAAEAVAKRLRELGWTPEHPYEYTKQPAEVQRFGDIVEMASIPGMHEAYPPESVACTCILDPFHGGPLVPPPGERPGTYMNRHLIDTPMEASFLLIGDSFSRIYQCAEPPSLGEVAKTPALASPGDEDSDATAAPKPTGTKRLLPGSAGFPSLLATALKAPVDYIVSDGGAATEVRERLRVTPEILDNKKVVVWEFTERDVALGRQGWREVRLPEEAAGSSETANVVDGRSRSRCSGPATFGGSFGWFRVCPAPPTRATESRWTTTPLPSNATRSHRACCAARDST